MDGIGAALTTEGPLLCIACRQRLIAVRKYSLCRACSVAVWRRVGKGEDYESALADRRRQIERATKGYSSGKGKRAATTAALLLCLSLPLWATEQPDRVFRGASLAFGAAVFADAWTTERFLDAGHSEMNPTLPAHPTDSRLFAQIVVFDSAVYLYARHLHKTRPRLAKAVLIVGALIHGSAAAHNDHIWDSGAR